MNRFLSCFVFACLMLCCSACKKVDSISLYEGKLIENEILGFVKRLPDDSQGFPDEFMEDYHNFFTEIEGGSEISFSWGKYRDPIKLEIKNKNKLYYVKWKNAKNKYLLVYFNIFNKNGILSLSYLGHYNGCQKSSP